MAGDYEWFQWTTEGLLMAFVGVVGLVGNLTSVMIYGRQRVQRTFHRLLLTLAAFDTVGHIFWYPAPYAGGASGEHHTPSVIGHI